MEVEAWVEMEALVAVAFVVVARVEVEATYNTVA